MKTSILVVDVGNTSTSMGIYRNGQVRKITRIEECSLSRVKITHLSKQLLKDEAVIAGVICSVVPKQDAKWKAVLDKCVNGPVLWVHHELDLGTKITYPHPHSIGADRLANTCGAIARYSTPVIIADFGTALTFDVVTKKKGYIGGVIAPGLPTHV